MQARNSQFRFPECVMIVIIGLVILVAAVVAGVAGVLSKQRQRAWAHPSLHCVRLSRDRLDRHPVPVRHRRRGTGTLGLSTLLAGARRTSRRGHEARRGLRQSRRASAAVSQDRDDLLGQRDTARAYTASTLGNGPAGDTSHPGETGGQRSRRLPFGRRPATPQAAAPPAQTANGRPASDTPAGDVPAGASAPPK
jgi:hypothetical protein